MIKLHGVDGTEIWLKNDKVVSVTKGCLDDSRTLVVVDALCECRGLAVNENHSVLELPEEVAGLVDGSLPQEAVDEKYCESFEQAQREQKGKIPF